MPCELAELWCICFFTCICLLIIACNREIHHLSLFFKKNWLFVVGKKKKISGSGRVRALNLTVPLGSGRVGSNDLGYGPGSGFSLKPVQTSTLEKRKRKLGMHIPSQQWHVGPRWGLHGRQMWAPLWACTRDPHWGQPWKPRRTKSGTCKGTAWVLIGQFMSARFGPHLPKGVKSGFAPGIHMGASRGCPDGF